MWGFAEVLELFHGALCLRVAPNEANGLLTLMIIIISCERQIELAKVQHLERSVIRRFPAAMSKCRRPAVGPALPRVVPRSSADLDKSARYVARKAVAIKQGYSDSRVETAVYYDNIVNSATGPEVAQLISTAMIT